MKLILEPEVTAKMIEHSEETYPYECCGFFFGEDGDQRVVNDIMKVQNAKEGDQRNRFRIDPADYREAERYATENNLDLLGIYHSHPDHPAIPSEHDRKVALPYFSYVILSVRHGKAVDIRSWRLNEQRQFKEEPLEKTATVNQQ